MDYRKIPMEELDSNIPEGRGMIKWAPFATMPEQFEKVASMIEDQVKVERPVLSDDRLEEMNRILKKALHDKRSIRVEYYYDGFRFREDLKLIQVDAWSMVLIGQPMDKSDEEMIFISFIDVLDVVMI
ncbi:YolD-like family protein [Salinicoccus hispanicus]|uniref:YolD-like family protein n=1 Tax=Salinicoccus hispanicus TaxID=157225 RepID=A0A6N8U2C4_9STAP|nr:YolD-like family protein [Salinicoccus hispanicus]MXQ51952.1 YolD-like family protein [Salinicoccus hispanicus]